MKKILPVLLFVSLLLSLTSCDDGGSSANPAWGSVVVTIWGEEFIEEGIPASEFVDGWSLSYDTFLVSVGDISGSSNAETFFADTSFRVFDLTQTDGPAEVATAAAMGGGEPYDSVDYTVGLSSPALQGNVTESDVAFLQDNGYGVYVEGTATDGTTTMSFAWGFPQNTYYRNCQTTIEVPTGGEGTVQLTIHGDHLFYDDLADPNASLRFATLAAADDGDGQLTLEELAAVSGTAFQALDNYGVGDTPIDNLRDYVSYLVGTLGHINGEGHCE